MAAEDVAPVAPVQVPDAKEIDEWTSAANLELAGLDQQIDWYDRKSQQAQIRFKWFKGVEITAAACIPLVASNSALNPLTGALGVLVTVLEGLLHLNQYQHNWITYRATCEALRHERYLYLAHAGAYASVAHPQQLLAERVDGLLSREVARWATDRQTSDGGGRARRHDT